jgi:CheY-like chemotaxis protein
VTTAAGQVAERGAFKGMHALVVDDQAVNRRILDRMLCISGMTTVSAANRAESLAACEATAHFDVIVMDCQLGDADGFELLAELRAKWPYLRDAATVMISSLDRSVTSSKAREAGVSNFLMKPVSREELGRALWSACRPGVVERPRAARTMERSQSRRLRVLLAEDNAVNRKLVTTLLERQGHETVVAEDGRQALTLFQNRQPFDLVLMDVQMPVMDGYEATAAIRAIESARGVRTPILALTANAMQGDRERCLAAGMDDHVSKPVQLSELLSKIEELCAMAVHS